MSALAKKNCGNYGIWKKAAVLFLVCLLFSAGGRSGKNLTYEQHILSIVTDHYYLTYCMLPVVLLCCYTFMEDDSEMVIGRFRSYGSYFLRKWLGAGFLAGGIVLLQSGAILLSGTGLPHNTIWTLYEGALEKDLFSVLGNFFPTPGRAFLAATGFQFAGIWMICALSMWICHFAGRKWAAIIFMALYVYSALGIKVSVLPLLPITGINHLLILHHNLIPLWRFPVTIVTILFVALILWLTVRYFWRSGIFHALPNRSGITSYYMRELFTKKNVIFLFLVVSGITLYKVFRNPYIENGEEWLYRLFSGHGTGYFQLLPFLEMLIVNETPLYLLAVFVEKAVSGQSFFVPVRLKKRRELMAAILAAGTGFICLYSSLWGIAGMTGYLAAGYSFYNNALWNILWNAILIKCLDILLQYFFMLALYSCTKQITVGFLALIGGNLLCILPQKISGLLPFGLSSSTRISIGASWPGFPFLMADGVLLAGILALISWLLLIGHRKL